MGSRADERVEPPAGVGRRESSGRWRGAGRDGDAAESVRGEPGWPPLTSRVEAEGNGIDGAFEFGVGSSAAGHPVFRGGGGREVHGASGAATRRVAK